MSVQSGSHIWSILIKMANCPVVFCALGVSPGLRMMLELSAWDRFHPGKRQNRRQKTNNSSFNPKPMKFAMFGTVFGSISGVSNFDQSNEQYRTDM